MTNRAILEAYSCLVVERRRIWRKLLRDAAVAFKAKLTNIISLEQPWIVCSVRRMAYRAPFQFDRGVFKNERALLIGVAFNAGRINADGEFCLLHFKSAVRVVAIAAFQSALEHLVVKRLAELRLHLVMTRNAKLLFIRLQHLFRRLGRFLF